MMWCSSTAGARPASHASFPKVARPPPAIATAGPGPSSGAAWSSAIRRGQPPVGAVAGDGDVAAEADEHATVASTAAAAARAAIGGERLRGRAEVELDARRNTDRAMMPVELDAFASRRPARSSAGSESPSRSDTLRERAVIAGQLRSVRPDRRVDEPARAAATSQERPPPRRSSSGADLDLAHRRACSASLSSESGRKRLQAVVECLPARASRMRRALGKRGRVCGRNDARSSREPETNPRAAITIRPRRRPGAAALCVGAWTDGTAARRRWTRAIESAAAGARRNRYLS